MTEYLAIGGLVFWAYIALVGALLILSLANDAELTGMGLLVGGLLVAKWLFSLDLGPYFPHTVAEWALIVICYLPVGIAWSFFKFYITYKASVKNILAGKQSFLQNLKRDKPSLSDEEISALWNKHVDAYAPSVSEMKGDIISWIACWPISAICYLLGDLLHDLVNWIYDHFSGFYARVADAIRNSIKDQ